jgi:lipid II:glycine glycyltransferase (peptidoglycan interpeptide bridge formation enzyme)
MFYHWSLPVDPLAQAEVHSLELDLTKPEEAIFAGFTSSTRNQVNRAKKEGVIFDAWTAPPGEMIDEFFSFFAEFTRERGLEETATNSDWLRRYAAQDGILLTRASDPGTGKPLVWHSYYRNPQWVRQLQSVSFFSSSQEKEQRNAVARANRFLHWMDILECRRLGISHFDFGGIYSGNSDEKLLRVNAFKQEFGGTRTLRYHSILPVSVKGKALLKARQLRGKPPLIHIV